MPLTIGFAWGDEADPWSAVLHREDEKIFTLEISQDEGRFPVAKIQCVNTGSIGLLAAGRNLWCWISWDGGGGPVAMFHGRLIGVPTNFQNNVVELTFIARPSDWQAQRDALAATLRVLPWFDLVWLGERADDADVVLETRSALWHWHRTTLALTTSDINVGEAGTLTIANALWDDTDIDFGESPLKGIDATLTVGWTQQGQGEVDLTYRVWRLFKQAGSPWPHPVVGSLTGQGLFSDWRPAGQTIGGGWSVSLSSSIIEATWLESKSYAVQYIDKDDDAITSPFQWPRISPTGWALAGWSNWEFTAPLGAYKIDFRVSYEAARQRSEVVTFSVDADLQPLVIDVGADERETLELTSTTVGDPIDVPPGSPGDLLLPIGDLRSNTYFKLARGAQSVENALLQIRAKLRARARAVNITCETSWDEVAADITCAHNVSLLDPRLPDGEATGKVISYALRADGNERRFRAQVEIGCTIGYGVALAAPAAGTGVYCEDGILEDGIQARSGAEAGVDGGALDAELQYQSFDDFDVTDDDGVDLFNMTDYTAVNTLSLANGPTAQIAVIDDAVENQRSTPDPLGALQRSPTKVTLDLKPVVGGAFNVSFAPAVSLLVIPQTINLESGASP